MLQDACMWASFLTPSLAILYMSQPERGGKVKSLSSVPSWKLTFCRLLWSPARLIAEKVVSLSHLASSNSGKYLYIGPLMHLNKIRKRGAWIMGGNCNLCIGYCQSIYVLGQHVWWNILWGWKCSVSLTSWLWSMWNVASLRNWILTLFQF